MATDTATRPSTGTPKTGDTLWYRLGEGFYGEWVPAKVVDRSQDHGIITEYDPPLSEDDLHLEISLNKQRHHSSSLKGIRLNVAEGTGYGQWQSEKPSDADAVYAVDKQRAAIKEETTREIMRANAVK